MVGFHLELAWPFFTAGEVAVNESAASNGQMRVFGSRMEYAGSAVTLTQEGSRTTDGTSEDRTVS